MDHEKIPYVAIVHGIDGTDINMILFIDFVNAIVSNFVKQNEDDAKHCANDHGMVAKMETNSLKSFEVI